MKAVEYTLPPNVYRKKEQQNAAAESESESEDSSPLAYLEIEVSRINFITDKSIKAQTSGAAASLYKNPAHKTKTKGNQLKASIAPSISSSISSSLSSLRSDSASYGVTAKVIWWGEQRETAGSVSVSISCGCQSKANNSNNNNSNNNNSNSNSNSNKQQSSTQQHRHQQHCRRGRRRRRRQQEQEQTSKLRYSVRSSSLALFLDYLRECPPIEIVASVCDVSVNVNDHASSASASASVPFGQTRLPLPAPLLRKYAANYISGCNFEHKTKIYALYRHVESGAASGQVQQQQQLKVGEIQLRFRMLFASNLTAKAAASTSTATSASASLSAEPLKLPAALLQDQLTITHGGYRPTASKKQQLQPGERLPGNGKSNNASNNNNHNPKSNSNSNSAANPANPAKHSKVRAAGKSAEIMEAMKKLDANLAALFADAEHQKQQKHQKQLNDSVGELWTDQRGDIGRMTAALFQSINAVQLHLEALTLQPEGTQRMELLQSEVRPIFTVECQLSQELIRQVPRYDMFHIMQFESEKFQSLTQCTRFGQSAQRQVRLPSGGGSEAKGSIDFTIWWREPGTCLNEMLGMGRLELSELYAASLLEQCKCIAVQRRGLHLASLYLKVSLRTGEEQLVRSVPNGNANSNSVEVEAAGEGQPAANCAQGAGNGNGNGNGGHAAATQSNNCETPPTKSNNNNQPSLDTANFMAETSKVRLLRGYIYASETRQLSPAHAAASQELALQPFWQTQPLSAQADDQGAFQLQEQFAIINDAKFLQCVERQQLLLELRPLGGVVRLPLHQFYIAYRDASITNHLCKGQLPVISIDGWSPILHAESGVQLGELKCLLAIGSEAQIAQLKLQRGFTAAPLDNQLRRTADLLDMLQNAPSPSSSPLPSPSPAPAAQFNFVLCIAGAAGLPLNPGYGKSTKKQAKRQAAAKRFPPNEPPNSYVTFQALSCNAPSYKSHEGLVYATPIVERSTTPQWRSRFQVAISADYLANPQKLFILRLWKKATLGTGATPTPLEDAIIGFAALNLSGATTGSYPSGWHNIVDFNGRVTGGLEAHLQPLVVPPVAAGQQQPAVDADIVQFEQSLELTHLQLGQAIKRKFTELEQISQRLRTRLVDVTGESLAPQFDVTAALDKWQLEQPQRQQQQQQPQQQQSNDNGDGDGDGDEDDDLVADFERALRTPTPPPLVDASKTTQE